jgi:CheY-like chemotaxis protein
MIGDHLKILVVDDNKAVQEKIASLLITKGHDVDLAINGLDALGKAQQSDYQLFVIDHLMPLMNGVQLTKNLNNNEILADIPVIFMTTQGTDSLKDLAEFSLFNKVIDKPINEKRFLAALEDLSVVEIDCEAQHVNG